MYTFSCDDCIHFVNGECADGREKVEDYEDAYDCMGFEDKEPV